ncbi:UNVERIFIED_CONTAM: hypothetical protein K2H54_014695 [Gekko kuhli]
MSWCPYFEAHLSYELTKERFRQLQSKGAWLERQKGSHSVKLPRHRKTSGHKVAGWFPTWEEKEEKLMVAAV